MTFSTPTDHEHAQTPAPAPQPRASTTLGVISLVLGIIAFLTGWVPGLGLVLGVAAIVLGSVSLRKRRAKGFSITGIILGSIATLVSIGVTIFLVVGLANWEATRSAPLEEIPEPAPTAEPLTAEEMSEFKEVDDATLAQILDDPSSHEEEMLIIYGSMGSPLVLEGPDGEELCLMAFSPSATAEPSPDDDPFFGKQAIGIAEGTLHECAMLDSFVFPDAAALSAKKKMWVVVSGQTLLHGPSDDKAEDLALFIVAQTE